MIAQPHVHQWQRCSHLLCWYSSEATFQTSLTHISHCFSCMEMFLFGQIKKCLTGVFRGGFFNVTTNPYTSYSLRLQNSSRKKRPFFNFVTTHPSDNSMDVLSCLFRIALWDCYQKVMVKVS